MDRGKSSLGSRSSKAKIPQQLPDSFIALGAKPSTSIEDGKRPNPLTKGIAGAGDKLKRDGPSSLAVPPSKKLKVGLPGITRPGAIGASVTSLTQFTPLTLKSLDQTAKLVVGNINKAISQKRTKLGASDLATYTTVNCSIRKLGSCTEGDRLTPGTPGIEAWEGLAIECDSNELFEKLVQSIQADNLDNAVAYILGVLKTLRLNKFKPCKISWSVLFSVASLKPELFTNDNVLGAMIGIIRRDVGAGAKGPHKNNSHVHQMILNLMCHAFSEKEHWPVIFVKLYVEDSIGDRVIIDNPFAKPFVDNIITAFHTKVPPSSLLRSETWSGTARDTSSPLTVNLDEDEGFGEQKLLVEQWPIKIIPRYTQSQEQVEQIVLEAIKDLLARRQQPETISKNFVRFLSTASGLNEIRVIGVSRIEAWLHNHKLMKPAQELLAYLCYNCSASSQRDLEVIAQLSKLRLKNKPMVNYFNNCLREMVISFQENLYPLLKYTVYNELSNARNPNNLIVVGALFQTKPDQAADAFADICFELLLSKDDYLRSLRALLKEVNRVLRHDFNLLSVVHALLRERKESNTLIKDHECRERIFFSLVDIATMCMLLCVNPQVRDAATQTKRDLAVLKAFKMQVSNIQRDCVTWLHDSAVRVYKPTPQEFHHSLVKVLFLEQPEHYYKIDSWPGENERNLFLRLCSEVPLLQATLLRILLIGISKEHPVAPQDVIEIVDQLIKRAANLPSDCVPPLVIDKVEILDFFFNLCSYNYPDNITLPHGYTPPKLAISNLYWRVWMMLLILAAHNPLTIGSLAWSKYPILKMFMEMCITNYFSFPPPTMMSLEEDYHLKEQQVLTLEKQSILELETHLAAACNTNKPDKPEINEQNSLLLSQLIELRPQGPVRRPPTFALDMLQTLNNSHRLGHLLCRSRHPDFLLEIMQRQGGTAHMPWLAELVHSSEGVLAHLPVQCLCEYLLSTAPAEKLTKHGQLLAHLRTAVHGNDSQTAYEVLEYLFRRLTSDHGASRSQATKGLGLILSPSDEAEANSEINWLSQYIKQFVHFPLIKPILVHNLRQALQIETNPLIVSNYINFLSTQDCYETFAELNDLINDLSSVVIERHSVASYVLPGEDHLTLKNLLQIFCLYTVKSKENAEESYNIHQSYNNEYLIVSWGTGEQCAMQPLVIHAAIVLLTYGPLNEFEPFITLLNTWFPSNMEHPRAYSPDTSETTSYLPDWVKLRMIRSNVEKLVDAAIEKLEPPNIVLFIQSFGIPTSSISKLLNTLDKATILDPKLVVDSVLDKTYMIQLVEVQNKRGAVGGEIFVKAIEMQLPSIQDDEIKIDMDSKKQLPNVSTKKVIENVDNVMSQLVLLFDSNFKGDRNKIILEIVKGMTNRKRQSDVYKFIQSVPIDYLVSLVVRYTTFSTLFRVIFGDRSLNAEKLNFATNLLNSLPKDNASAKILSTFVKMCAQKKENMDVDLDLPSSSTRGVKSEKNIEILEQRLETVLLGGQSECEKSGLLVNWLSAVELEIANSEDHKLQVDLMFSKRELHFRPLLMSLLLQRASWKILHNIMAYLLRGDHSNICPVSTLDFLMALIISPKLWQGRDKSTPKHSHFEDVLRLNQSQVQTVVKYILEESEINQSNWKQKMESRLQLLLKCIGDNAVHIVKKLFDESERDEHSRELLLMIYMSLPYSAPDEIQFGSETAQNISSKTCPSAIDEISHCLLSALTATPRSKDWSKKSQDLELCARKLTATHPILVLRQLPMLAGSLKGRAQYDWGVLRSRGHLKLFEQILGLMELLQPHIFHQTTTLKDLMESYFLLLQFHSQSKDLGAIVKRLVTFIQNWMIKDVQSGSRFLQEHGGVLNDIQFNQPGVRPLLSSVSLPIVDQEAPTDLLIGSVNPPIPESYPQQWSKLKSNLLTSENLAALQEIEHLTSKRPQLLESVAQYLYGLIKSSNNSIRSLALNLILRWLKHNPNAAPDALPAVLSCLDSESGDVLNSLLEKLPELVPVMQEYAKIIFTKVFELGMKSDLGSTSSFTRTINLLNLQYGC